MRNVKLFFLFFIGGTPVGATAASFIAPPIVKIMHAPAAENSALCNCNELADAMISSLFQAQIVGLITGGVLGIVLFVVLKRMGKLRAH